MGLNTLPDGKVEVEPKSGQKLIVNGAWWPSLKRPSKMLFHKLLIKLKIFYIK